MKRLLTTLLLLCTLAMAGSAWGACTTANDSEVVNPGNDRTDSTYGQWWIAYQFTIAADHDVTSVEWIVGDRGETYTSYGEIWTDSEGSPGALVTGCTGSVGDITDDTIDSGYIAYVFSSSVELPAGTYWAVVRQTAVANNMDFGRDTVDGTGTFMYSANGAAWEATAFDVGVKVMGCDIGGETTTTTTTTSTTTTTATPGVCTATTDNCSHEAVQRLIYAASVGDTVCVNADNCTWDSTVLINKAITLQGSGMGASGTKITSSGVMWDGLLLLEGFTDNETLVRITGFQFDLATLAGGRGIYVNAGRIKKLRIDHNTFHHGYYQIETGGAYGVIDNNLFYNGGAWLILNGGSRAHADASWVDMTPGTANAIFVEDNKFILDANWLNPGVGNGDGVDGSQGGKIVFRHNEFDSDNWTTNKDQSTAYSVGFHGSAAAGCANGYWQQTGNTDCRRSPSIIEVYENSYHGQRIDWMITLRGGSGLIYNNTHLTTDYPNARISLREEEYYEPQWSPLRTAWPAEDQIHNTFIWGNSINGSLQTTSNIVADSYIVQDRDYYLHAPCDNATEHDAYGNDCTYGREWFTDKNGASGSYPTGGTPYANQGTMVFTANVNNAYIDYTPYTYPHPLRNGQNIACYRDADNDTWGNPDNQTTDTLTCATGWVTNYTDCNDSQKEYIDSDTDTYGSQVTTNCGVANSTDCDDTLYTIHDNQTFYRDADSDTFGAAATTVTYCDNSTHTGYVTNSSDCDDADNETGVGNTPYYRDADNDTYGDPAITTGACPDPVEPPAGYVTNDTDCNVDNATWFKLWTFYADADEDTYGDASVTSTICDDLTPPATPSGYVTVAGGMDCDDTNGAIYVYRSGYRDADNDTYTTGVLNAVCSGAALPAGYRYPKKQYLGRDDCNDNATTGPLVYRWVNVFDDADNDTYVVAPEHAVCMGATILAGYRDDVTALDCNDNVTTGHDIYPGATEACNSIDDDCDGVTDADYRPLIDSETEDSCGVGACAVAHGHMRCAAGVEASACEPLEAIGEIRGNSIDDNCDGNTDESNGRTNMIWSITNRPIDFIYYRGLWQQGK
jgi:hypothetical protein